mmetsp:Transcript_24130/g.39553  ORF Transcript_24130/g.39553 Transcript_24130/m.39553 type:complete len:160 (-) Transcript_24130:47-526(-)
MKGTSILLLLLAAAGRCTAFICSVPPHDSSISRQRRCSAYPVEPNRIGVTQPTTATVSRTYNINNNNGAITLSMAAPGQSDEQAKQERDAEIRATIARLKSKGKIKQKNSDGTEETAEDSAMREAEAFFNKPVSSRIQERMAEQNRVKEAEEEEMKQDD